MTKLPYPEVASKLGWLALFSTIGLLGMLLWVGLSEDLYGHTIDVEHTGFNAVAIAVCAVFLLSVCGLVLIAVLALKVEWHLRSGAHNLLLVLLLIFCNGWFSILLLNSRFRDFVLGIRNRPV